MSRKPRCHYDGERGWCTPEHQRDCTDRGCRGCRPCGKTHCAMRGRCPEHVEPASGERTCPRCIGKVRADLAAVEDLYATMAEEAEHGGVESEAFVLHGPAADPDQWEARRQRRIGDDAARGWCDYPKHEALRVDPWHPYTVLGRWDMAMREQYGPPTDLLTSVTRSADYLRGLLAGPFPHGDEFEEFASELARCRAHLETVAHDSRAPEEGRHCPWCIDQRGKGPRLRKRYAAHPGLPPGMRCAAPEGKCRICGGLEDTWHCPDVPEHWCSERDYRNRVAADYRKHARLLTAADIHAEYGIKPATLRKRAERDPLIRRGKNDHGQQLYDVTRARKAEVS